MDTAKRVAAVVDTVPAHRPVHVTGHSLGAYVGLVLLTLRPDRFSSALLSGFHVGPIRFKFLLRLAYLVNDRVMRIPFLNRRFASVFEDQAFANRFVEGAKGIPSGTIRCAGFQVIDFSVPPRLDTLTMPVLAVAGSKEPEAIRSTPAWVAKKLAHGQARVLEGRDHLWPIKEPALYASLLAEHLSAVRL